MNFIYTILIIFINLSYAIGLKALVIPNNAEIISVSGTGIAGNIDVEINPASIVNIKPYIGFSNNNWLGDLSGNRLTYYWEENSLISFESLGLDEIELRDEVPNDEPIGYTEVKWLAIDISQKLNIDRWLKRSTGIDMGYKVKFNYSKVHTDRYYGYTLDFGLQKNINDKITIGAVIKNLGKEYDGSSYSTINPRIGIGTSISVPFFKMGWAEKDNDGNIKKDQYDSSILILADIIYEDERIIYKIASKTNFPYINLMFGTSYSEGYRDFA